MATFQQLKQNIGHAWEYLAEGWDSLTRNAITHFTANAHKDPENRNTGWVLMAWCLMMTGLLSEAKKEYRRPLPC